MKEIISVMAMKNKKSTRFNCSDRGFSFDSIRWNMLGELHCRRWITATSDYNVPNISTTIFSSNRTLIFGRFAVRFKPYDQSVGCDISVERMDFKTKITNFSRLISIQEGGSKAINLPKPIIILENIKYKIQLDFSLDGSLQLKKDWKMKQEVELENDAKITFHRDESSNFNTVKKGVINSLVFNEINF